MTPKHSVVSWLWSSVVVGLVAAGCGGATGGTETMGTGTVAGTVAGVAAVPSATAASSAAPPAQTTSGSTSTSTVVTPRSGPGAASAAGRTSSAPSAASAPAPTQATAAPRPGVSERDVRARVAAWKSVPYRENGSTKKGIGNAQFAEAVAKELFTIDLPSRADEQMKVGKLVERIDLQPGDLVFFEGKGIGPFRSRTVAVFLGRDDMALSVKERGVIVVKLSDDPWSGMFKTGRRISQPVSREAPEFNVANYGANRDALLRDVAKAWVGTLYKQGGTTFAGIGNDEFVRSIYEAINDDDLVGAPQQWAGMGKSVKRADLQPGDIILYEAVGIGKLIDRRHAGMYIGNGEFVHAVKGAAVTISKLDDERWKKAYRSARRIEPDMSGDAAQVAKGGPRNAYANVGGRHVPDPERKLRDATAPWLGTPYKLGGTSKSGVDCSAFVRAVYLDVYASELPRTAEEQERLGKKIDRKDLQPGDLVFFRTKGMGPLFKSRHVGVYVGGGEFAQASGRLGVNIMSLSNRYWSKKYEGARRLRSGAAD